MKQLLLSLLFSLFGVALIFAQVDSRATGPIAQAEIIEKGKVAVFPNPAIDYIELRGDGEVAEILIYNVVGRQLKSFKYVENKKYSIADLREGMYLIQFIGANKKILTTQRLSKR